MKIIAKTAKGYLVEASQAELTHVAGYFHATEVPGWQREGYSSYNGSFPIGTEIKPSASYDYLKKLREAEADVKKSEGMLRALADMLHQALPETIVPPDVAEGEARDAV